MMTKPRPSVLVTSWDEMLLRSRSMTLGAYFSVQPAGRFSECVQFVRNNPYDPLTLCHTLNGFQQETLANMARETYPPVEVLVLQAKSSTEKPYADHVLLTDRGPGSLCRSALRLWATQSGARFAA